MKIRNNNSELDIAGPQPEWNLLAKVVLEAIEGKEKRVHHFLEKDYDPTPFSKAIHEVFVLKKQEKLSWKVSNNTLLLTGSEGALQNFIKAMPIDPETEPNYHIHYDYISSPNYVEDGVELVMTLTKKKVEP